MSSAISWSPEIELQDSATRGRPAIANNGGVLCIAWRGMGRHYIWVSTSQDNGQSWSAPQETKRSSH